jgi:hypothetical protein
LKNKGCQVIRYPLRGLQPRAGSSRSKYCWATAPNNFFYFFFGLGIVFVSESVGKFLDEGRDFENLGVVYAVDGWSWLFVVWLYSCKFVRWGIVRAEK